MLADMRKPDFQQAMGEAMRSVTSAGGAPVAAGRGRGAAAAPAPPAGVEATATATLFSALAAGQGAGGMDTLLRTMEVRRREAGDALVRRAAATRSLAGRRR